MVAADHGEGLGDHGEDGHGMFLYETTIHVPLIIRAPRPFAAKAWAQPCNWWTWRRPSWICWIFPPQAVAGAVPLAAA